MLKLITMPSAMLIVLAIYFFELWNKYVKR